MQAASSSAAAALEPVDTIFFLLPKLIRDIAVTSVRLLLIRMVYSP